ncbi:MAG: helix-turn-helix domain-containing protein, partial [Lachnospiraceae bacterium]|nr:helix-turn-helix domain-containing protein [Lachnospiraceae bacterium]
MDYEYFCRITANLAGIPIRVYRGEELLAYSSPVRLDRDPMLLCRDALWAIRAHVGYHLTEDYYIYGVITSGDLRLIAGPTRQTPPSRQEMRDLAFRLGLTGESADDFCRSFRDLMQMPLESLLLMLCSINHMLNGETLELADLTITTAAQETLRAERTGQSLRDRAPAAPASSAPPAHTANSQEEAIHRIVRRGDRAALSRWTSQAPAVRGGLLAPNELRQQKNLFIVTATLVSRAAIRGGLDVEEAFLLSDYYIQNCERLDSPDKLANLQYHMVNDFTERVERLHLNGRTGRLATAVANYVQRHLSEVITTEELARSLYMGRTHLSARFHAETGVTLSEFIRAEKTEEAKRLLRYTDRSAAAISEYLAFSSPAH